MSTEIVTERWQPGITKKYKYRGLLLAPLFVSHAALLSGACVRPPGGSQGNSPVSLSQRPCRVDLRLDPRPWPLTSLLPYQRETPRDLPLLHPLPVFVHPHGGVRHMKCQSQIAGSGSELKTLPQRVCAGGSSDSAGAHSWYWVSVSCCILPHRYLYITHARKRWVTRTLTWSPLYQNNTW